MTSLIYLLCFSPIGSPLGRYSAVFDLSSVKILRYVAVLLMLGMVLLTMAIGQ